MNDHEQQFEDESQLEFRQEFTDDLSALFSPSGQVPGEVDRAILDRASAKLSRRSPMRVFWRVAAGVAVAAVVMVGVMVWHGGQGDVVEKSPGSNELAFKARKNLAREDVDQNGHVDILDAFALARRVKQADIMDEKWDVNGDGVVDGADVDVVAMVAVKL
ncbi:MAG: hypothetical protein K9M57_07765 [Phycisphaerae bacterium]|nr:hypothetical protein [Phycisphaerae bacterium]